MRPRFVLALMAGAVGACRPIPPSAPTPSSPATPTAMPSAETPLSTPTATPPRPTAGTARRPGPPAAADVRIAWVTGSSGVASASDGWLFLDLDEGDGPEAQITVSGNSLWQLRRRTAAGAFTVVNANGTLGPQGELVGVPENTFAGVREVWAAGRIAFFYEGVADATPAPTPFVIPADVVELRHRWESCWHWGGEDAYDEERGRQIRAGIERDCADARNGSSRLREKYAGSPDVLREIDAIEKEFEI